MTGLAKLRPHQIVALDRLKDSLRAGKRRPLLQLPTGAGKTVVAAHIVHGALSKGNRVAFIVPMLNLIDQTFSRFVENGIDPGDMGVIQGDHEWRRPHAPIQICSVQTLARRGMPDASVLVIDEAHVRDAKLHAYLTGPQGRSVAAVGLSATPFAKGLGRVYDDLISPVTMRELIGGGYLSNFRVFAPSHPDLSGVKIDAKSGDYQTGELSECMSKAHLVADIVATWLEKAQNRPTLCFAVDRAHAAVLHDQFEKTGISSAYVDANTPRDERAVIAARFQAGEIKVICNIGTMTTGVDLDVRCIIFARPTKSESLFVQCIGRGLRTADGKDDCIARDSLVLTDKGTVKIQDITLDHKVWDGVNFVAHAGAICKGVQPVISHDGVTATPEHLVMTSEGWKTIEGAYRLGLRIARTGMGSAPIRFTDDCLKQGGRVSFQSACGGRVRKVWAAAHGAVSQFAQTSRYGGVPALQWAQAGHRSEVAVSAMPTAAGPLPKSIVRVLRSVWGAWDRVSVFVSERCGGVGGGKSRHSGQVDGIGPQGKRWSLRAGEPALGASCEKYEQHPAFGWAASREVYQFSENSPRDSICGQDASAPYGGDDGRSNHSSVGRPVVQAEREVWDILNAGPLQRFTVNGRLVHNCIILDHSDTHLRLGMVTDISIDQLDDGKPGAGDARRKDKLPPLPKECSNCQCLVPIGMEECPNCGHVSKRSCSVEHEDGELVEIGKPKRKGAVETSAQRLAKIPRSELFGQIKHVKLARGWSDGRAAHVYRDITGTWPNNVKHVGLREPSAELLSFIRHKDLAYAKSRTKNRDTMEVRYGV